MFHTVLVASIACASFAEESVKVLTRGHDTVDLVQTPLSAEWNPFKDLFRKPTKEAQHDESKKGCGKSYQSDVTGSSAGLRYKGYVISMDEQIDRYENFSSWWCEAWPELEIERVPAVTMPKRGHGVALSWVHALDKAMADGADVVMMFEDDAKPFEDVSFPGDLEKVLDDCPQSMTILALGGHHFMAESPKLEKNLSATRMSKLYGAYAWAVRKDGIERLRDLWTAHAAADIEAYDIDVEWWKLFTDAHPAFVATPLLVDHGWNSTVWSNTWDSIRHDEWQGKRDWWNQKRFGQWNL
jgi:hypothetical protein